MKKKTRIIAIIQARMGSSRLPGKVLMPICDQPMIAWVIKRASRSRLLDEIIVATTTDKSDDDLVKYCEENGTVTFRGSPQDVLDRYYKAALSSSANIIVRLTADCPLLDGALIDAVIQPVLAGQVDFCANRLPPPFKRTYPIGLDVEVVTFPALEKTWSEAAQPYEREHVLPYIYTHPELFRIKVLDHDNDLGNQRWTVDTPKDLEFVKAVLKELGCRDDFHWQDIERVLTEKPELKSLNVNVAHKTYLDVDERATRKNT